MPAQPTYYFINAEHLILRYTDITSLCVSRIRLFPENLLDHEFQLEEFNLEDDVKEMLFKPGDEDLD